MNQIESFGSEKNNNNQKRKEKLLKRNNVRDPSTRYPFKQFPSKLDKIIHSCFILCQEILFFYLSQKKYSCQEARLKKFASCSFYEIFYSFLLPLRKKQKNCCILQQKKRKTRLKRKKGNFDLKGNNENRQTSVTFRSFVLWILQFVPIFFFLLYFLFCIFSFVSLGTDIHSLTRKGFVRQSNSHCNTFFAHI